MGMPCQVNSILKLCPSQGYPASLAIDASHHVQKDGYRIFPMDVPLCLVDAQWLAYADVIIDKLTWQNQTTHLEFRIVRIYDKPFAMK